MRVGQLIPRGRSRFQGWLRFLAAFLLLELVVAQLWPALHHAAISHVVCAEHGELVHIGPGGHAQSSRDEPAHASLQANEADEDSHHHCQLPLGAPDQAVASAPAAVVALLPGDAPASVICNSSAALGALPLLSLAPKQSPPDLS